MTPELAAFSDWTLALLPRLFLYPGGLSVLAALLLLRPFSGGLHSISPRAILSDLPTSNLLSIALSWAAISLAPFPDASPLPFPVDRFALAILPALSLLLDITYKADHPRSVFPSAAITLALLVPALAPNALLPPPASLTISTALSMLAVASGLLAISPATALASQTRWLAWLCLGLSPLWPLIPLDSTIWASIITLLALIILSILSNLLARAGGLRKRSPRLYPPGALTPDFLLTLIAWLLALAALFLAIPFGL